MDSERLKVILYNAIVLLEEGFNPETLENYEREEILVELGMTKKEYDEIMNYLDE